MPSWAWTARLVLKMRRPKMRPTMTIVGYGRIAHRVTIGSIRNIMIRTVMNANVVLTRLSRPAPHIARTVWTSLVSRDMTSPVGFLR